ncbi:MAG: hypothetical protein ACRDQ4_02160 [Pseudonocardiaceae bacterium]
MYRIRTYPEARDAIASLPEIALVGYVEALGVMKLVPWSGESINKTNPGGEVRQLVFGPEGRGMVTYLVLEHQQLVDVLEVQWVGE